ASHYPPGGEVLQAGRTVQRGAAGGAEYGACPASGGAGGNPADEAGAGAAAGAAGRKCSPQDRAGSIQGAAESTQAPGGIFTGEAQGRNPDSTRTLPAGGGID